MTKRLKEEMPCHFGEGTEEEQQQEEEGAGVESRRALESSAVSRRGEETVRTVINN